MTQGERSVKQKRRQNSNRTGTIAGSPLSRTFANMTTIAPKRGFSVATPLLRASCVSFQVPRASQYQVRLQFV